MLKAVDEEEIRKAYIRMYDGMIAKDEKVLQEVLDDSFVHKGLGRLRYRSGRRKADVHRTSCAPISFEPGGSGEKGSGYPRDPACELLHFVNI